MRTELLAFTERGYLLAERLAEALHGTAARCNQPDSLADWTAKAFRRADALVFVGAAGIAVRACAPHLRGKAEDPAVVVVDELGRYAIPILSGHLGGANALAQEIAACCGAVPVITTATDVNGLFAVDDWAREQGFHVRNPKRIKEVSAKLLRGEPIRLHTPWIPTGEPPAGVLLGGEEDCDFRLTIHTGGGEALCLIPPIGVLGVGCRKGMAASTLERVCTAFLAEAGICPQALCRVCSIDLKREEPGLLEFCRNRGLPFETFPAGELAQIPGEFTESEFVREVTGVDNVCERSAVRGSGGALLLKKRACEGVTLALALTPFVPAWPKGKTLGTLSPNLCQRD